MKSKLKGKAAEKTEYLKLSEVGKLLKVGTLTLRKFQRENGFPIISLGSNTHRIRRDALEQWLKNNEGKE
jgi:excisionase family DNA binding protein